MPTSQVLVRLTADTRSLEEQLLRAAEAMAPMVGSVEGALQRLRNAMVSEYRPLQRYGWLSRYDDHHPRPLCINGHDYRRRTRSRRGGRR